MTDSPGVTIISRNQWRAKAPKYRRTIATPTDELWLHHFASEHHGAVGMRAIQQYHMDSKGWSDIAYSFCVDDNGDIYEGRGAGIAGGHTKNRNSVSHAICLMGNFHQRPVPRSAMQSAAALAALGIDRGWWTGWTSGHRNAPGASTSCPGDYAMRAFTDLRALTDLYRSQPPAQEDDVRFTVDEAAAYVREAYTQIAGRDAKDGEVDLWAHAIAEDPREMFKMQTRLVGEYLRAK